jgi:hypothetical protein
MDEVNRAGTVDAKKAILERHGFVNTEGDDYESSGGGITIGVTVPSAPQDETVFPQWTGGVDNIVAPWVQGTIPEWQAAAQEGAGAASVACVFITATAGAAACAYAVQRANAIIQQDASSLAGLCLRYYILGNQFLPVRC